jgi:hypothetical protein
VTGTDLVERLVQAVAISHRIEHRDRAGLILLASPESGKTTIACAATSAHVVPVSVITGRSVLQEIAKPEIEYLLFNDLAAIKSLGKPTTALLITLLNQLTNGEKGIASFAGRERTEITRPIGIIGCLPFEIFKSQRYNWREMGFVSRLIPFAYSYPAELVATIKDALDLRRPRAPRVRAMPATIPPIVDIACTTKHAHQIRVIADARAASLQQLGIRLLKNYHVVARAHALLEQRRAVTDADLDFLRAIDRHVSITACAPLEYRP